MKLYFARHGHTDANLNSIPNPETGEVDEPLNHVGIQQANTLAESLKDISFDKIISSPLNRAYQTADIANKYHELPIEIDGAWRERDIGAHVSPEIWHDLFDFDKNISLENSENLQTFFQRIYAALDALKVEYKDKTVLLVSHGGVHQAVYAYVNNLPLQGNIRLNPLRNCEYKIYEI